MNLFMRAWAVAFLLLGLTFVASALVDSITVTAAQSAGVCSDEHADDCLVAANGRVTDIRPESRDSEEEYLFTPADEAFDATWISFGPETRSANPAAVNDVALGRSVRALYWDDEPAFFVTSRGRIPASNYRAVSATGGFWAGFSLLAMAVGAWRYPRLTSSRPDPSPRRTKVINASVVSCLFAGIGAAVYGETPAGQALIFAGSFAGLFVLLLWVLIASERRLVRSVTNRRD